MIRKVRRKCVARLLQFWGQFGLLSEEAAAQRAEQERQRADQAEQKKAALLERLSAKGIAPNELLG